MDTDTHKPINTHDNYVFGRPTKYKPEYCQKVIELGKTGASLTKIACELGLYKGTLYDWAKKFPDFSLALKISKQYAESLYEEMGAQGIFTDKETKFNTGPWALIMNNRFGWTTRQEVKQDTNIQITIQQEQAENVLELANTEFEEITDG